MSNTGILIRDKLKYPLVQDDVLLCLEGLLRLHLEGLLRSDFMDTYTLHNACQIAIRRSINDSSIS